MTKHGRHKKHASKVEISQSSGPRTSPLAGGAPLVMVPPGADKPSEVAPNSPGLASKNGHANGASANGSAHLVLEPASKKLVRLDLGCGARPKQCAKCEKVWTDAAVAANAARLPEPEMRWCDDCFEGVDAVKTGPCKHVVDLFKFPWPWEDSSVDEIHCSHFAEHIPMEYVGAQHVAPSAGAIDKIPHEGKDLFLAFFDECYRILKPGATMKVIVPAGPSYRAFQDPTHRRFIFYETFGYLSAEWRKSQKLDHYNVACDFMAHVIHTCQAGENERHPEAAAHRFMHFWNVMGDIHATLTSKKPA